MVEIYQKKTKPSSDNMRILGIESSCDDTAIAILDDDKTVVSLRSSQDDIHTLFGGVVPELASRQHLKAIQPLVNAALQQAACSVDEIDLIAATQGPGLVGSLLVGFSYAKALACVKKIPLVGVDHIAGHLLSIFLNQSAPPPAFPYISLLVSGGNTALYLVEDFTEFHCLGRTRDDAAGEAFDKVAKLLNLPYPGGPQVASLAVEGDNSAFAFPRSWLGDSFDFSFSGLKTAVRNQTEQFTGKERAIPAADICASFQEAVIDVLSEKTIRAAQTYQVQDIAIGGGVSANNALRQRLIELAARENLRCHVPPAEFCTDNAAMIAFAGKMLFQRHGAIENMLTADVFSRSALGQ